MSIIRPFRALRPVAEKAEQVSCVPYDVADESEVRGFINGNPESFLRVTRPEAEIEHGAAAGGAANEAARRNLKELIATGVFVQEAEPALYIYRLETSSHSQTGVVAVCSLDEYEKNKIKRHEKTRPDKVIDRTNHMLALGAQTGLIFLTYRGTSEIDALVSGETANTALYDFTCRNDVKQTVWKASRADKLVEAFNSVTALYIADGHHRIESAARARAFLRSSNAGHTGQEDYNFVVAGIFPAEQLRIMPYNRVVKDLGGLSDDEFLAQIAENFVIIGEGNATPASHGEICVYVSGKWRTLKFAVDYFREPDPVERLDVSILQNYILAPILGIPDPRTDKRIDFIGGARGTLELEQRVDAGDARVAFSLYPTTMADLLEVSDAGEIMPPKSTWFEPKLKDGLFVHMI